MAARCRDLIGVIFLRPWQMDEDPIEPAGSACEVSVSLLLDLELRALRPAAQREDDLERCMHGSRIAIPERRYQLNLFQACYL